MAEDKIRILFLIGSYGTGGKERQMAEVIKVIPRDKFAIHLIVKQTGAYYLDSMIDSLDSFYVLNHRRFGLKSIFQIYKFIHKLNPDIVHSWEAATTVMAILIRFFCLIRFKIIDGTIRQSPASVNQFSISGIERLLISSFSDLIIANSKAGLKCYNSPKKKSIFIYNGFDFNRIQKLETVEDIRLKFGIKTRYVIGMVARFDTHKDWATFISCAQNILKKRQDLTFLAIGDGTMINQVKNQVYSEFHDYILFTGPQINVESLVNAMDIGVLTSTINGEGISNSILEYMALGKPVVATSGGGTPELVEDSVSGFIIPPYDPAELEKRITQLIDNEELRKTMGNASYQIVCNKFNIERMGNEFNEAYSRLKPQT